jgi:GNAT superfamily N-acetyltransferase
VKTDAIDSTFEEWLNSPVERTSRDPRFEVRRATQNDFERIFDLVDTVFGTKRARTAYEWLYRANPTGIARCWLVIERSSGSLVANQCRFPWPVAHGSERIEGEFSGDFATLPRLQRQGLYRLCVEVRDSHARQNQTVVLGAPNAKSRGALAKIGRQHYVLGPLPFRVLPLDFVELLCSRSWPRSAARIVGVAANEALGLWHKRVLAFQGDIRIEEIKRFDSSVDALTHSCMMTPSYWCPHEADFLNWRYLQHPVNAYVAQAALVNGEVMGYCVVRIENDRATLMEFAASTTQQSVVRALLGAAIGIAREAGCHALAFYATRSWRFWGLFSRVGFLKTNSDTYRTAFCPDREDVSCEENWQLLPGDKDVG